MLTPSRPGDVAAGTAPLGPDQASLAKGRDEIVRAQRSVLGRASFPTVDLASNAGAAKAEVDAQVNQASIEYLEDKVSASQVHGGTTREFRIARCTCAACGQRLSINQSRAVHSDDWAPDEKRMLNVTAGWVTDGDRWYCGVTCQRQYKHKMAEAGTPVVPVERIRDASFVKRFYATPPAAAPSDETTVAAPPMASAPVPVHETPVATSAEAQAPRGGAGKRQR